MSDKSTSPRVRYIESWAIRGGLLMLLLGTGPLLAIVAAANLGLTSDPNPNPIGPGMLAGFTFLPSIALIFAGVAKVAVSNRG
jgi:hypothetical protein